MTEFFVMRTISTASASVITVNWKQTGHKDTWTVLQHLGFNDFFCWELGEKE